MKKLAIVFFISGLSLAACDNSGGNDSSQEEPGQQGVSDPDFGSGGRGVDTTANDVDTAQYDVGPELDQDTIN